MSPLATRLVTILLCPLILLVTEASAAELYAYRMEFRDNFNTVEATGSVELRTDQFIIHVERLVYDRSSDTLTVEGPVRIVSTDSELVAVAEFAELSRDYRQAILHNVRVALDRQHQILASEVRIGREDSTMRNAYHTACQVCRPGETPTWSISAEEIFHSRREQRIYYRNARFHVGGLQVAYIPWLSIPDSSVERADGFLVPDMLGSNRVGTGVRVPYFKTIGDHADVTVAPVLTTDTGLSLELEHRRAFRLGELTVGGTIAPDGNDGSTRVRFITDGTWSAGEGQKIRHHIEAVSDPLLLSEFGYSRQNRLESFIESNWRRREWFSELSLRHFHSLADPLANREVPYLVAHGSSRWKFGLPALGGQAFAEISAMGFERLSGRDALASQAQFNWQRSWLLSGGFALTPQLHGKFTAHRYFQDPDGITSAFRLVPAAAATLRYPFLRSDSEGTHELLEPMIQFVAVPIEHFGTPNDDSVLFDIDSSTILSIDRFAGFDRTEAGNRINAGLTYTRVNPDDSRLALTAGKVFRINREASRTADNEPADLVIGAEYESPVGFSVGQHTQFHDDFKAATSEWRVRYTREDYTVGASYSWLSASSMRANSSRNSESIHLFGNYSLNPRWSIMLGVEYDVEGSVARSSEMGLNFEDECTRVRFLISQNRPTSFSLADDVALRLNVSFGAFGLSDQTADVCSS